ncbi:MAG: hypothetical protein KC549_09325, partial [Myxococcales bacterium]|nr:hypothetical protein [Myxococcales bacterium]
MRPLLVALLCGALPACIAEHPPIAPDDDAGDAGWPGLLAPPSVLVEPAALDFGAVEPGTSATRTLRLTNDGRSTLMVQAVALEGPPGFAVNLDGVDVIAHPEVLLNPDGMGGEGLSRGAGV